MPESNRLCTICWHTSCNCAPRPFSGVQAPLALHSDGSTSATPRLSAAAPIAHPSYSLIGTSHHGYQTPGQPTSSTASAAPLVSQHAANWNPDQRIGSLGAGPAQWYTNHMFQSSPPYQGLPYGFAGSFSVAPVANASHTEASRNSPKRTRTSAATSTASTANKRSKRRCTDNLNNAGISSPAVYGIGPVSDISQNTAPVLHPLLSQGGPSGTKRAYGSLIRKATLKGNTNGHQDATDIWFFVHPLESASKPDASVPVPDFSQGTCEKRQPLIKKFARLACKLCAALSEPKWHTWANSAGQHGAIRTHLQKFHLAKWQDLVISNRLLNWQQEAGIVESGGPRQRPGGEFSVSRMHDLLFRWMVPDDQAMNLLDNEVFRDWYFYSTGDKVRETDLPRRSAGTEGVIQRFETRHNRLVMMLKRSLGRVATTSDVWSDGNLHGFMAVTVHFCTRDPASHAVRLHAELGAFRYIRGSHTGTALGTNFVHILQELSIVGRMSLTTLDNATNCNTMMEHVADKMNGIGIPFDQEDNRGRFPHVGNLAAGRAITELKNVDVLLKMLPQTSEPLSQYTLAYIEVLRGDIVVAVRELVSACRGSGLRREALEESITEANEQKAFGLDVDGIPITLTITLTLLRDVDVRWSSIYLMIDRVLDLYPAIHILLDKPECAAIQHFALSDMQLTVLQDVHGLLIIFHAAQELLSGELTPTICLLIPTYEKVMRILKNARAVYPLLVHAIQASQEKLEEYMEKARSIRVYALAMIINPTVKLEWLRINWTVAECDVAKTYLRKAMLEHRKAMRTAVEPVSGPTSTSCNSTARSAPPSLPSTSRTPSSRAHAAIRLNAGFSRLAQLEQSLSMEKISGADVSTSATLQVGDSAMGTTASGSTTLQVSRDTEEQERAAVGKDEVAVDAELSAYVQANLEPDREDFDVLKYWEKHEAMYPILFRVAMDILPIQASAVSCERVFSSSSETDTKRRNKILPHMMEVYQLLKQSYSREGLLDFSRDWAVAREDDLSKGVDFSSSSGSHHTTEPIDSMHDILVSGRMGELAQQLNREATAPMHDLYFGNMHAESHWD